MCQVYGPTPIVSCPKCHAAHYENAEHECKVFVPFEKWDAELQERARKPLRSNANWLLRQCHNATVNVAGWPEWMRRSAWADEFRYSVQEEVGG